MSSFGTGCCGLYERWANFRIRLPDCGSLHSHSTWVIRYVLLHSACNILLPLDNCKISWFIGRGRLIFSDSWNTFRSVVITRSHQSVTFSPFRDSELTIVASTTACMLMFACSRFMSVECTTFPYQNYNVCGTNQALFATSLLCPNVQPNPWYVSLVQ